MGHPNAGWWIARLPAWVLFLSQERNKRLVVAAALQAAVTPASARAAAAAAAGVGTSSLATWWTLIRALRLKFLAITTHRAFEARDSFCVERKALALGAFFHIEQAHTGLIQSNWNVQLGVIR